MTARTWLIVQRLGYFAAGVLFSRAAFFLGFRWPEIYERIFHQGFNYDSQPTWYRIAGVVIGYLPLISIGVLILVRLVYRRAVRPVAYSIGVGAFYAGLFALLIVAESRSPF